MNPGGFVAALVLMGAERGILDVSGAKSCGTIPLRNSVDVKETRGRVGMTGSNCPTFAALCMNVRFRTWGGEPVPGNPDAQVSWTPDPAILFDYASLPTLPAIRVSPDPRRGLP
jgi:hypothetical protein